MSCTPYFKLRFYRSVVFSSGNTAGGMRTQASYCTFSCSTSRLSRQTLHSCFVCDYIFWLKWLSRTHTSRFKVHAKESIGFCPFVIFILINIPDIIAKDYFKKLHAGTIMTLDIWLYFYLLLIVLQLEIRINKVSKVVILYFAAILVGYILQYFITCGVFIKQYDLKCYIKTIVDYILHMEYLCQNIQYITNVRTNYLIAKWFVTNPVILHNFINILINKSRL